MQYSSGKPLKSTGVLARVAISAGECKGCRGLEAARVMPQPQFVVPRSLATYDYIIAMSRSFRYTASTVGNRATAPKVPGSDLCVIHISGYCRTLAWHRDSDSEAPCPASSP